MIGFFCPFCKQVLQVPAELAGTQISCSRCNLTVRVPQKLDSSPPPAQNAAMATASAPVGISPSPSPVHLQSASQATWFSRLFSRQGAR